MIKLIKHSLLVPEKSFRVTWGLDPSKSGREVATCFLDEVRQSVQESTNVCRSEAKPKIPTQNKHTKQYQRTRKRLRMEADSGQVTGSGGENRSVYRGKEWGEGSTMSHRCSTLGRRQVITAAGNWARHGEERGDVEMDSRENRKCKNTRVPHFCSMQFYTKTAYFFGGGGLPIYQYLS